jgi:hypothetical protein
MPPLPVPGRGLGIASLVLGLCSIVLTPCIWVFALIFAPVAVTGLVLGIIGRKKACDYGAPSGFAIAGIVLNIAGLLEIGGFTLLFGIMLMDGF